MLTEVIGHVFIILGYQPSGKVASWFLLRFKSLKHSNWPSSTGSDCSSLQLTSWWRNTVRGRDREKEING